MQKHGKNVKSLINRSTLTPTTKILILVGTLNAGGLERQASSLCLFFKRHPEIGVDAGILCLWKKDGAFLRPLEDAGVEIFEAPNGWRHSIRKWYLLRLMFKNELAHFHIIHSFVNYSIIQQVLAAYFTGKERIVFTERSQFPFTKLQRFNRIVQDRICLLLGVRFSANSEVGASYLSKTLFRQKDSFPVIKNGVEIKNVDLQDRGKFREKYKISDDKIVILYVARFAKMKGHERMIKLFSLLCENNNDILLIFAGDGPKKAKIESEAQNCNGNDRILFLGQVTNIYDCYHASNIVCLFSDYEGMSNAILEAMSMSLPILATNTGDLNQLLSKEQLLSLPFNMIDAYEKLNALCKSAPLRLELGKKNQNSVSLNHSFKSQWKALESFYA